jgi:hypothetical protein
MLRIIKSRPMREQAVKRAEERSAGREDATAAAPGVDAMPKAFRVIARSGDLIGEADTMEEVLEVAKSVPPGRYRIERISTDPASDALRTWDWGTLSKNRKGTIKLDLPPWLH